MLLFAYGTLQVPQRVCEVVGRTISCRVVGGGAVRGVLYDVRGAYPALRPSASANDIVPGVLLELDEDVLPALDAYEGVAEGLYVRERCAVQLDDGTVEQAWIYIYSQPIDALRRIAAWPPPG